MTWLSQWPLDEASSGTSPTTAADAEASPVDLSITFAGAGAWTSDAAGNGLSIADSATWAESAALLGGKLDFLDGTTTFSIECVVDLPSAASDNLAFHIGDGSAEIVAFATYWQNSSLVVYMNSGSSYTWDESGLSAGLHHVLVVVDTTESTAADRVKLYVDGVQRTLTVSDGSLPSLNQTFALTAGMSLALGAAVDGSFSWGGQIYWGAIADHAAGAEASDRSTALLADNDSPPAGGGSAGAIAGAGTVAGVGASTATAAGAIAGTSTVDAHSAADEAAGAISGSSTVSGAGAALAASAGAFSGALTLAGSSSVPSVTWVSQWPLDEASSGTTPTTAADIEPDPVNLNITFAGAGAWTSVAAGSGLSIADTATRAETPNILGTKLDFLDGTTTFSLEGVLNLPIATSDEVALHIGDGSVEIITIATYWSDTRLVIYVNGASLVWDESGLSAGLHHLVVVVDTTEATAADRVRLYVDGTQRTLTLADGSLPSLNQTFELEAATRIAVGSVTGGSFSWSGAIYWAAIGAHGVGALEAASRSTGLLADNDAEPAAGGDAAGTIAGTVTISGAGASQTTGAANGTIAATATIAGAGAAVAQAAGLIVGSSSITTADTVSASGRRFLRGGQPFLLVGQAAWSLGIQLNETDAEAFIADQASRGYNTLLITLLQHRWSSNSPPWRNNAGDLPFSGTVTGGHPDFSTPVEAFWEHIDWLVAKCAEYGIIALLDPLFIGFNPDDGWHDALLANGSERATAYGTYLGNRYKDFPNILWVVGGDRPLSNWGAGAEDLLEDLTDALKAEDPNHIVSLHLFQGIGNQPYDLPGPWQDWNFLYTSAGGLDDEVALDAWNNSSAPSISGESLYRDAPWPNDWSGPPPTDQHIRGQAWRAMLSGASGAILGDEHIWHFVLGDFTPPAFADGPYTDHLDSNSSADFIRTANFLQARAWHLLEPSQGTGLVTAGGGTLGETSYKPRALASDGSWGAIYVSDGTTVTVNRSLVNSGSNLAYWYDPTNGSVTPAGSSSTFVASSAVGNNSAGGTDWVLVLEALQDSGAGDVDGTGTLAAVGRSLVPGAGAVSATGALAAGGRSQAASAGAVSSVGSVAATGLGLAAGVGSVAGVGTIAGAGAALRAGAGAIAGVATVTGARAALASGAGAVSGTGTVSGLSSSPTSGAGDVDAICTIAGAGRALAAAAALVACVGSLSGASASSGTAAGSIASTLALTGAGRSQFRAAGTCSGTGTVTATGAARAAGAGAISATGTLSASGDQPGQGSGSIAGTGTVSAAGAVSVFSTGQIAALASLLGTGSAAARGTGILSVTGVVFAAGAAASRGGGTITAAGTLVGASAALAQCSGSISATLGVAASTAANSPADGTIAGECTILGTSLAPVVDPPSSFMEFAKAPSSVLTFGS